MPNLQFPVGRHSHEIPTITQVVWIPNILRPATRPDLNALLTCRLGRRADDVVEGAIAKVAESVEMGGEGDGGIGAWGCEDSNDYDEVEGGCGGGVEGRRGRV